MFPEFLNSGVTSDHSSMVVDANVQQELKKKMFIYFIFWTKEEGFYETLAKVWRGKVWGNPMCVLMTKLRYTKQELKVEEHFQRHKSREDRIPPGNGNTSYFFKLVQAKRVTNRITYLRDVNGDVIEDIEQIGNECISYYKALYAPDRMDAMDFSMY
ncbi:hypothetical protein FRX31_014489 [Thalictrum thalictroides]|uniref:Uncharacterized protein n=1 Tax=Thalictrum thalictroides TaxID=46969 RepID=A0A7J6WEP7_THATH|nr:hypothetical protein FRX31_014489 [Thalictrum thalictroides]